MVNSQFIIYKWRLTDESDEWPMMKGSWSSLKICLDRNVTIEGNAARHLMLVASHAESPLGDSKWLERKNCGGESLPLGRRYGFSCPLPKGRAFRLRHSSSSHLPYLSERLYGWLLTSDAYGIFPCCMKNRLTWKIIGEENWRLKIEDGHHSTQNISDRNAVSAL